MLWHVFGRGYCIQVGGIRFYSQTTKLASLVKQCYDTSTERCAIELVYILLVRPIPA
jgi:hypothetical protein